MHDCIIALKLETLPLHHHILLSFLLKPLILPHYISLHPAFYLASYQLQSSFQYPSPEVHFPLSIIIPSQGSLFGPHSSSPKPIYRLLF